MPSKKTTIFVTEFDAYNERIKFGDNYIVDNKVPELRKGTYWTGLASILTFASQLNNKKDKPKQVVKHQERSYDKMRLSLSHDKSVLNKSLSSESIRIPTDGLFIDHRMDYTPRKLSKRSDSFDTISSDDYKSDIISDMSSGSHCSSDDSTSMSSYESECVSDINERQKSDTMVRVVQRFGGGFHDSCLFPLALTLDLSDLTKGKITWDSINSKADLALNNWCSLYSRKVNRVLSTDFVCPDPSLQNKLLLQSKRIRKPLKRWNSMEDLYVLNGPNVSTSISSNPLTSADDNSLFARQELTSFHESLDNQYNTNCMKRKASQTSYNDESLEKSNYETIILSPISSPLKRVNSLAKKPRTDAKSWLTKIRANTPQSLALYITEIDKQYYLQLKDSQVFQCMTGECSLNQNMHELKDMLEFGSELTKFVVSVIRRQYTPDSQGIKIAGFIEVACFLRKLRNWQSLVTIIRALQSPKIYFMEEAWMAMKSAFPIHFNDYLKLCRLVRLNQTCIIGSTYGPSIPTLTSLVSRISIHCIATWDLLEHKRRWTEQPSIAGWVDNELIGQLVESQKLRQKQDEQYMLLLDDSQYTLLPLNDKISLIHYSSLPNNWRQKDAKHITQTHLKHIVKCFQSSFEQQINFIRQYNIPNAQN